jgi:radical SAM-linked protein
MKGVKVNFTDVRISAMEDFIGRGDRRLSAVVRRAWELGAGMDSWYDSVERAYTAWGQAIAEAGLTWKYRQVENGEWNVMEEDRSKGDSYDLRLTTYDLPLPWEHIDTGIDKQWLKADLQKALAAATVPDCSFDGCSHCGVCGVDFGHNVVVEPSPIPQFAGHFVPNTTKVQRLRVWFGKIGDMALVSHLDLLRLFERAIRRAALPISFSGGFHSSPRISIALALSLGSTSSGEIVDFELTQQLDLEAFREQLSAQLPGDIPIYQVANVDLKAPSAMKQLSGAEYLLSVANPTGVTQLQWREWVETIKSLDPIWWEQTSKSGKTYKVNLRDRLFELEASAEHKVGKEDSVVVLRYIGSCEQDGNHLRPEHVMFMFEQVVRSELQLLHIHRQQLILESTRN